MKDNLLAIAGAIVGGVVGWFGYGWCVERGFVPIALPGGLAGIGAGLFACRARWVPIACGVIALAAGVAADWYNRPFKDDQSLVFYLKHITNVDSVGMLTIFVGAAIGFWLPYSRMRRETKNANQGRT